MIKDVAYWDKVRGELMELVLENIRESGSMARWYELNDAQKYALCFAFPKASTNAATFKRLQEHRRNHFRGFERNGL